MHFRGGTALLSRRHMPTVATDYHLLSVHFRLHADGHDIVNGAAEQGREPHDVRPRVLCGLVVEIGCADRKVKIDKDIEATFNPLRKNDE